MNRLNKLVCVRAIRTILPVLLLITILTVPAGAKQVKNNWTVMVYMDADNNLERYAIQNFLQMSSVGSNNNVSIVVQMDRIGYNNSYGNWTDAKRFYVTKNMTPTPKNATMDLGEVDMGNPQTLANFITWAVKNYPAKHYILILWDHGGGWRDKVNHQPVKGVCWDYTNSDHLTLPELEKALANAESQTGVKLDVVGFDACQMGMIEVFYQIRNHASIAIASEDVELAPGWPYKAILHDLTSNPAMTPNELAETVVSEYSSYYRSQYPLFMMFTMAAVNLTKMDNLATSVDKFAKDLIASIPGNESVIAGARLNSEEFCLGSDYVGSIDLYSFAELIYSNLNLNSAKAVMEAVNDAVVAEAHGSGHPNAHGVAIYYPKYWYDKAYEEETSFAADTSWDEYVKQAPHEIPPGLFKLFIKDVYIYAHANQNCTFRVVFYGSNPVNAVPDGVKLGKFLEIEVKPKGAIDEGFMLQFYTKDDLKKMGIREDQIIGEMHWDANKSKWKLWEYSFEYTDWLGSLYMSKAPENLKETLTKIDESVNYAKRLGLNFEGFVCFEPWHPYPPNPRVSEERTIVALAATKLEDYPLPIQYPQWLHKGWNLVSIPVIPLKTNISEVLSGYLTDGIANKVEAVWMYDAKAGEWYGYSPTARGVGELKELKDGVGYWFKMKEPAMFTVVGVNARSGPYAPPEYELSQGWNLIATKAILPIFPADYLNTVKGKYARLEGYHRSNDAFYPPKCLEPQQAYWIYMKESGKVPGLADEFLVNYTINNNTQWMNYLEYWTTKDYKHLGYEYQLIYFWYYYYYVLPQLIHGHTVISGAE